jgi:transcriptional regulator with XRE-family HTH domain
MLKLRDARKELGMSVDDVSREIGVHRNTLLSYERGKVMPKADQLFELARIYDKDPEWLLKESLMGR